MSRATKPPCIVAKDAAEARSEMGPAATRALEASDRKLQEESPMYRRRENELASCGIREFGWRLDKKGKVRFRPSCPCTT